MGTIAQDSFTRSDQSGLGTSSDGKTWTRDAGIGVSNIVSNQGRIGPGGGDSQFLLGSGTAATVNVLCRIKSGDSGNVAAVLFRYNTTGGTNGYRAGIFGGSLICDKYVTGSRSNIGSTSISYNVGEEWWVRAIASGTSITVAAWKDGTSEPSPQLNLTDSSVTSAGQYGISVFMSNDFTYFDSLTITDNQSIVTRTRTITATAALYTTSTRTISDTAALLATNTRTVLTTAALQATPTRVVPTSASLLAMSTRTIPDSAALLATEARTIPDTAALYTTNTRTISDSAALLATSTRSVPCSAALTATGTNTIPTSAALSATRTRTIPATASLAVLRIIPCTAALTAKQTRTIQTTASLSSASSGPSSNAMVWVASGQASIIVKSGQASVIVKS